MTLSALVLDGVVVSLNFHVADGCVILPPPPPRYEVNPDMVPQLEAAGLAFVGKDETGERMEIVELQDSPAVRRRCSLQRH